MRKPHTRRYRRRDVPTLDQVAEAALRRFARRYGAQYARLVDEAMLSAAAAFNHPAAGEEDITAETFRAAVRRSQA